jgi:ribosomal protein L29
VSFSRRNGIGHFFAYMASSAYQGLMEKLKEEQDEDLTEKVNELLAGLVDYKHESDTADLDRKLGWLAEDNPYKSQVLVELETSLTNKERRLNAESCLKIYERLIVLI